MNETKARWPSVISKVTHCFEKNCWRRTVTVSSALLQGRKGAFQGSQMDPLAGPIAGLVEGDTFIQTPLLGYGSIDPPEKGAVVAK